MVTGWYASVILHPCREFNLQVFHPGDTGGLLRNISIGLRYDSFIADTLKLHDIALVGALECSACSAQEF
jgi:hypothetical protein